MWPAIDIGQNVIAVGNEGTGKSMGYIAPLASRHLDQLSLQRDVSLNSVLSLVVFNRTSFI